VLQAEAIGRRTSSEKMHQLIIALCTIRPFTAKELGQILNRSQEALVTRHLSPLIISGKLVYTIPENLTHRYQAYTIPSA
jgi:hypothetical protein